jgi:hypothetical protein
VLIAGNTHIADTKQQEATRTAQEQAGSKKQQAAKQQV